MTSVLLKFVLKSLYSWQCLSLFDSTGTLAALICAGYKYPHSQDFLTPAIVACSISTGW